MPATFSIADLHQLACRPPELVLATRHFAVGAVLTWVRETSMVARTLIPQYALAEAPYTLEPLLCRRRLQAQFLTLERAVHWVKVIDYIMHFSKAASRDWPGEVILAAAVTTRVTCLIGPRPVTENFRCDEEGRLRVTFDGMERSLRLSDIREYNAAAVLLILQKLQGDH